MDYRARFYSPLLNRFIQPDSIVPNPMNPQMFNRFSYVGNNPINFNDHSGHARCNEEGECWDGNTQLISNIHTEDFLKNYTLDEEDAEDLLISGAESPLHAEDGPVNYSGFGGCNTNTLNCTVDGHHPAIDSSTDWANGGGVVNWEGRPIYATADGIVVRTGWSDFGNYVMVEHYVQGVIFYSVYAHLQNVSVTQGTIVDSHTQIGTMGGTKSSGTVDPHLHFEIRKIDNVDLSQSNPFQGEVWWPMSLTELNSNFVDLGATHFANYSIDFFDVP